LQRWLRERGRISVALLVATGAVATAAATAAPATAAGEQRYDVWSCRGPLGEPVPTTAWTRGAIGAAAGDVVITDGCAAGGPLELALAPGRSYAPGTRATAAFVSPAGTHLDSWEVEYVAATLSPGYAAVVGTRKGTVVAAEHGCTPGISQPCEEGTDAIPASAGQTGTPVLDALDLWAGCAVSACDPELTTPTRLRLFGSRVEIHDLSAPARPELSGTLVAGAPLTGTANLIVSSSDEGGGVASTTLSVDGGIPQVVAPAGPRGTCAQPYTVVQPCPSEVARAFTVDTSTLQDGAHEVAGTVVDTAGNVTAFGPVAFTVEHPRRDDGRGRDDGRRDDPQPPPTTPPVPEPPAPPAPPAGNGRPAVRAPRLRLDRAQLVRRAGRSARVRGTLRTGAGTPIAGARLTVVVQELGTVAQLPRELPDATTNAAGRFAFTVRGRGAERVTVAFAPSEGAADTVRAAATVREPASLTIARSRARLRRGQAVVLRGSLKGAGGAARGAVVELQAIVSGDWRTVGTVRADRRGRYAWRYRFVGVTRDTLFSFRSLVRSTPGWPWPELRSGRLNVRVDAVD
jgi:hypothetical protein